MVNTDEKSLHSCYILTEARKTFKKKELLVVFNEITYHFKLEQINVLWSHRKSISYAFFIDENNQ